MRLGLSFLAPAQNDPAPKTDEKKEKTMFKFRVARPTDNLPEIVRFYRDGLGLEVLTSFENHEGFDGVMLGHKGFPYHLEFTHHQNLHGRIPRRAAKLDLGFLGGSLGQRLILLVEDEPD